VRGNDRQADHASLYPPRPVRPPGFQTITRAASKISNNESIVNAASRIQLARLLLMLIISPMAMDARITSAAPTTRNVRSAFTASCPSCREINQRTA